MKVSTLFTILSSLAAVSRAHEAQEKRPGEAWQVWHMREEHALDEFDSVSFFTLHDLDGSGTWTPNDVLNLYGLLNEKFVGDGDGMGEHKDSRELPQETKELVLKTVLDLVDYNKDGIISQDEWKQFSDAGNVLPDFGLGSGHHGDYEYEYEVHHWLKYHAKDDPDVKIVHEEDLEHERLYHAQEHQDHPDDHDHDKPAAPEAAAPAQKVIKPAAFGTINLRHVPGKYLKN